MTSTNMNRTHLTELTPSDRDAVPRTLRFHRCPIALSPCSNPGGHDIEFGISVRKNCVGLFHVYEYLWPSIDRGLGQQPSFYSHCLLRLGILCLGFVFCCLANDSVMKIGSSAVKSWQGQRPPLPPNQCMRLWRTVGRSAHRPYRMSHNEGDFLRAESFATQGSGDSPGNGFQVTHIRRSCVVDAYRGAANDTGAVPWGANI
jgi:hypothetical protein